MSWMDTAAQLRQARVPAVLITLAAVRGHAPREAGAKMIVTADGAHGTIGGGNLEMTAITRAREILAEMSVGTSTEPTGFGTEPKEGGIEPKEVGKPGPHLGEGSHPEMLTLRLNDKAPATHGKQCCGGEVTILFEPLPVPQTVAIFGIGAIGLELARILGRQDIDLHLSDSRPEQLDLLDELETPLARVHREFAVVGEEVLMNLPAGTHVLILTHDHAEDLHLCDAALRRDDLGSVGLIGSRAKWQRFRTSLRAEGHADETVDTIDCPIGLPDLPGKYPATIAVSVAAELLQRIG